MMRAGCRSLSAAITADRTAALVVAGGGSSELTFGLTSTVEPRATKSRPPASAMAFRTLSSAVLPLATPVFAFSAMSSSPPRRTLFKYSSFYVYSAEYRNIAYMAN
jgi:hypothetical protein